MLTSSLLLSFSSMAAPQVTLPDRVELLVRRGDDAPFVDASGTQWYYEAFIGGIRSTPEGGWMTRAVIRRDDPLRTGSIVIGQDGDALGGPVVGFLVPDFDQPDPALIRAVARAGGRTAWIAITDATGVLNNVLYLDEDVFVSRFDPVNGAAGWSWNQVEDVRMTSDGSLFASGNAFEPTIGNPQVMLTNTTTGEMLLNGFDFIPGLNRRLDGLEGWSTSNDGAHWIAEVELRNTLDTALVLDGEAYELAPGFLAMRSAPLPPQVEASVGAGTWGFFFSYAVNSKGDVLIDAFARIGPSGGNVRVFLLNGEVLWTGIQSRYAVGLAEEGTIVAIDERRLLNMESEVVTIAGAGAKVDVDRDGVTDPFFNCRTFDEIETPLSVGPLHFMGFLASPTGDNGSAIFRARPLTIGSTVCTGEPNSSGRAGDLVAVGSPVASETDLSLEVFSLPVAARGYALFSRTTGTPFTPAGSAGSLCLSGSLGRLQTGLFLTGATGRSRIEIDLVALPQPAGSVAAIAGDTWYAQAWHRDTGPAGPTSNFTSAIQLSFD